MLGELVDYLIPLITTSVNTLAMQQAQGSVPDPTTVMVYDTRAVTGDLETTVIPLVKVMIADELPKPVNLAFGTGNSNRVDAQLLLIEVWAQGPTRSQATIRAELLLLAVESSVYRAQTGRPALRQNDLGGTTSYNSISSWYIKAGRTFNVKGPGDNNMWTSVLSCTVEVWIDKYRS